jgi:hypothetical protein
MEAAAPLECSGEDSFLMNRRLHWDASDLSGCAEDLPSHEMKNRHVATSSEMVAGVVARETLTLERKWSTERMWSACFIAWTQWKD